MRIKGIALWAPILAAACGGTHTAASTEGARHAQPAAARTTDASEDLEPAQAETSASATTVSSTSGTDTDAPRAEDDPAALGARLARVRWDAPQSGTPGRCRQEWIELQLSLEEIEERAPRTTTDEDDAHEGGQDADEDEVGGDTSLSGWNDHQLDAQGRVTSTDWNSDAVGLSGEFRYRYDARGDLVQVQEIPYESIEGGRPPRPAPTRVRTIRTPGSVELVHTRGRELVTRERYGYDERGRVILRELVEGQRPDDSVTRVRCEYDERGRPSAREWEIDDGHWRAEYVYEGDVLVAVRQDGRDATLWSRGEVFFQFTDEERAVFYAGSCYALYFDPCAAAAAPPATRGAAPPAPPPITFGRPLPPAAP